MLGKRAFKQMIIGGIYVLIFSTLSFLVYWIVRPDPTCFDGKKNQGEQGIDCGGPCAECEVPIHAKGLKIERQDFVISGSQTYDVAIKVKNPNEQYGASYFQYKIELLDAHKKVIASRKGTSFILPKEEKYLIETNLHLNNKTIPTTLKVKFDNYQWSEFTNYYEKPQLNVYQKHYEKNNSPGVYVSVYGLVKNESHFDFNSVTVKVILKDKSDNILAVNTTQMNTLAVGEERDFRLIWPHNFPGEISQIEVEPEADVYDTQNFTKKFLPHQKFQSYEDRN